MFRKPFMTIIPKRSSSFAWSFLFCFLSFEGKAAVPAPPPYMMREGMPPSMHMATPSEHWMVQVDYAHSFKSGLKDGTKTIAASDLFNKGFPVAPQSMSLSITNLSLMYRLHPRVNLMVSVPYIRKNGLLVHKNGSKFGIGAKGFGDVKMLGRYVAYAAPTQQFFIQFGVSLPTGAINKKGTTPFGHITLPYMLQLGTGTVDPMFGLEYVLRFKDMSWTIGGEAALHLYKNSHKYHFGNMAGIYTELAKDFTPNWKSFIQVRLQSQGKAVGSDPNILTALGPPTDPKMLGGQLGEAGIGLAYMETEGWLKHQNFRVEFGLPYYQQTNGPGFKAKWYLKLNWSLKF